MKCDSHQREGRKEVAPSGHQALRCVFEFLDNEDSPCSQGVLHLLNEIIAKTEACNLESGVVNSTGREARELPRGNEVLSWVFEGSIGVCQMGETEQSLSRERKQSVHRDFKQHGVFWTLQLCWSLKR